MTRRFLWVFFGALFLVTVSHVLGMSDELARPFGFDLPAGSYDPTIPTPDKVLNTPLGERPLTPEESFQYLDKLAKSSDRAFMKIYGKSHEGRPLAMLWVSDAENIKRREELSKGWHSLAFPDRENPPVNTKSLPLLVWLIYSVHGDEHSSTESALTLAYYLLARKDAELSQVLKNVVVVIDPLQNPDGRARYVQHVRQYLGVKPDAFPLAAEHQEPWPSGRFNHYLFDLNRDWMFQTQGETIARLEEYRRNPPQVVVDFHEMGSDQSYFFAPPTEPVFEWIPDYIRQAWEKFGRANALAFEERGWPYFFRETFDVYYPGYGDSYPSLQGAAGMTYEQASAEGTRIQREDGRVLTLGEAIEHHFISGLTTVYTAASLRSDLLRDYAKHRRDALISGKDEPAGWIIPAQGDAFLRSILVRRLIRSGALFYTIRKPLTLKGINLIHESVKDQGLTITPGDLWIPYAQPARLLLRVMFENHPPLDPDFIEKAMQRRARGEDPGFYDITAWSLPLAWNLEVYRLSESPPDNSTEVFTQETKKEYSPKTEKAPYAYLICSDSLAAFTVAGEALTRGYPFRVSRQSTTVQGHACPPGSLLFFGSNRDSSFMHWVQNLESWPGLTILSLDSGWVDKGISLGSDEFRPAHPGTSLIILAGSGVSPSSLGALWFTFERYYHWPIHLVFAGDLNDKELDSVYAVIIPNLSSSTRFRKEIEGSSLETLKRWVERGGTLIVLGKAAEWAVDAGFLDGKVGEPQKSQTTEQDKEPLSPAEIPGSLLWVEPVYFPFLTAGLEPHIAVFFNDKIIATPDPEKSSIILRFADSPSLIASGYAWPDMVKGIAKTPYAWSQTRENGSVIALLGDPVFRGDFFATHRFFMNILLHASTS